MGIVVGVCCAAPALAERLPLTTYTTAQGLAGDIVNDAVEDAQGFLWIATEKGLSRFDGRSFRNFGKEQGLDRSSVTSLAMGKDGALWVGVWGGVYRFDPANGGSFAAVSIEGQRQSWERVQLAIDSRGQLWCAADGLYRLETTADRAPVFRRVPLGPGLDLPQVESVMADRTGNIWTGFDRLYRRSPTGQVSHIERVGGASAAMEIVWLVEDVGGRVWAGTRGGLEYVDVCEASRPDRLCLFPLPFPVDVNEWHSIVAKEDGGLWVGTRQGLLEIGSDKRLMRKISAEHGLVANPCRPLLLDSAGDLWVASDSGIQRLAVEGFTSFGPPEGLEATQVSSILLTREGDMVVNATPQVLQRYDGHRFAATRPRMPAGSHPSWGWFQIDMQDHRGQWWIPTADGLVRFPHVRSPDQLATARPVAVYAASGCFSGHDVFRLYEDSRGDIWIGTIQRGEETLYRWNRATDRFDCFQSKGILGSRASPTAFQEDAHGTVWIGFGSGQVARYRNGLLGCVIDCGAGSRGAVQAMLLDRRGRLWIANAKAGILRIENPGDPELRVLHLTMDHGLSSNLVRAVVEDRFGRTYIGTDRGVDVLEEATGRIRHYGPEDGLPHPYVTAGWSDPRSDAVWFGTLNGVARFTPPPRLRDVAPPRVLLDGIRVSGIPQPLSATGEGEVAGLVLGPDQKDIQVDFVGLPRRASSTLRFQYRRSPAGDWSVPSANRSLVLTGLSDGDYRYEIRASDASGVSSIRPAAISFRVLAPIHRRPWFLALAGAAVLAAAAALYQARVARLIALERQRRQIAMDLHDELGSRLGSIGLLADLAAERSLPDPDRAGLLEQIGEMASDMGSSLTDFVWSLREGELTIDSLARQLAERGRSLFPDADGTLETDFPERWPEIKMSLGARRNAFLIGLEALHNAARHSGATRVVLTLHPNGRRWRLVVADNGKGIGNGEAAVHRGFGFETMRLRAADIAASIEIDSQPGRGTRVTVVFDPVAERRRQGSLI